MLANDGAQAVAIFDPNAYDMVLMDVAMPVLDGYQATRLIKQNCGDIFIPVLFLTAMSVDEAMMTCVEHGGDDFLTKPYNRTVLRLGLPSSITSTHKELGSTSKVTVRAFDIRGTVTKVDVANSISAEQLVPNALKKTTEYEYADNGDILGVIDTGWDGDYTIDGSIANNAIRRRETRYTYDYGYLMSTAQVNNGTWPKLRVVQTAYATLASHMDVFKR